MGALAGAVLAPAAVIVATTLPLFIQGTANSPHVASIAYFRQWLLSLVASGIGAVAGPLLLLGWQAIHMPPETLQDSDGAAVGQ
jgi:hypothetical protein